MTPQCTKVIGIDPGLQYTGWGIIDYRAPCLCMVAAGTIKSNPKRPIGERLNHIYDKLMTTLQEYQPQVATIEESFVNCNARTSLRLGFARGIALLAATRVGIPVTEYSANLVKQVLVGAGHADKTQIQKMIKSLVPAAWWSTDHDADALAVAICHIHHIHHYAFIKDKKESLASDSIGRKNFLKP